MRKQWKKSRADYPDGILAIHDNGGRSLDRYFVVYDPFAVDGRLYWPTLSMSKRPNGPQGIGLRGECATRPTRAPGDRVISLDALPDECRRCVDEDLRDFEIA